MVDPLTSLASGRYGRAYRRAVRAALAPAYRSTRDACGRRCSPAPTRPRRGDHGRQPPMGGRRGPRPGRRPSAGRREGARAHRLVRRPRDRRGHAVGALDREPRAPDRRGFDDHRRGGRGDRRADVGSRRTSAPVDLHVIGRRDLLPAGLAETVDRSGDVVSKRTARSGSRSRSPTAAATSSSRPSGRRSATLSRPRRRGRAGRRDHGRIAGRPPVHAWLVRPGPHHPDVRRDPAVGLPAVAERLQRVPLLRGVLAGVPRDRLPAGDPDLPAASAPVRTLTMAGGTEFDALPSQVLRVGGRPGQARLRVLWRPGPDHLPTQRLVTRSTAIHSAPTVVGAVARQPAPGGPRSPTGAALSSPTTPPWPVARNDYHLKAKDAEACQALLVQAGSSIARSWRESSPASWLPAPPWLRSARPGRGHGTGVPPTREPAAPLACRRRSRPASRTRPS